MLSNNTIEYSDEYFYILGIIGLIVWTINYFSLFKKAEIYLPRPSRHESSLFSVVVYLIGACGWVFLIFSLTNPKIPQGFSSQKSKVNDIYFVVDVSRSMLANDFKPNRLEAAKKQIINFIELRPTDRISIVMFSEKAFTLLPLTSDLELIREVVGEIKVGFLGSGTNIGDALALSVARGSQSITKNKVAILLTDGVSNVGTMTPIQAAEEAMKQKMKVYTIGIGGSPNAKIPLGRGVLGSMRYQNLPGGSIDTETLNAISRITGAKSYTAGDVDALKDVFDEINNLEKTEIESSSKVIYKYIYYKYLLYAVVLILLSELLKRVALRRVV